MRGILVAVLVFVLAFIGPSILDRCIKDMPDPWVRVAATLLVGVALLIALLSDPFYTWLKSFRDHPMGSTLLIGGTTGLMLAVIWFFLIVGFPSSPKYLEHRASDTASAPSFLAHMGWIQSSGDRSSLWFVQNDQRTPIYSAILVAFTNLTERPMMIDSYIIMQRMGTDMSWEQASLRRGVGEGKIYAGNDLRSVQEMNYTTFDEVIQNKNIASNETVRGWLFIARPGLGYMELTVETAADKSFTEPIKQMKSTGRGFPMQSTLYKPATGTARIDISAMQIKEAFPPPSPAPSPVPDVAELINWQRGNPETPPYVDRMVSVKDGNLTLSFSMYNKSNYPGYDISVRVWDIGKLKKRPITQEDVDASNVAIANIPTLAPNVSTVIGKVEIPATEPSKRFGAQYTTRLGAFSESIRVELVEGKWLFAIRAANVHNRNIMVQRVDPGFPLNDKGEVDW